MLYISHKASKKWSKICEKSTENSEKSSENSKISIETYKSVKIKISNSSQNN